MYIGYVVVFIVFVVFFVFFIILFFVWLFFVFEPVRITTVPQCNIIALTSHFYCNLRVQPTSESGSESARSSPGSI